jgi:hypothetical protein
VLLSPVPFPNAFFGDDVIAIHNINNGLSLAIVGESGRNRVHVYISQGVGLGTTYTLEQTLTVPEAVLPQHRLFFSVVGLFCFVLLLFIGHLFFY